MKTEYELSYKDINLIPRKCIVDSREECDTSIFLGKKKFVMPIFPANMKSVVSESTCIYLAKKGWFYTMHRFGVDPIDFTERMHKQGLFSSISIGINEDSQRDLSIMVKNAEPEYITIDVANAWADRVKEKIAWIKTNLPNTFLIVGNVASAEAVEDLQSWGADCCKVGISGGKVCITRQKTGFFRPMISTLIDCVKVAKIPIIADGGVDYHGDISKSLVLGATMVMAGFLFAGYEEASGEVIEIEGKEYKQYFGSASKYNKSELKNIEGKKILIPYRGSMDKLLKELKEDLQSAISYAGGKDISAFKNVKYSILK